MSPIIIVSKLNVGKVEPTSKLIITVSGSKPSGVIFPLTAFVLVIIGITIEIGIGMNGSSHPICEMNQVFAFNILYIKY